MKKQMLNLTIGLTFLLSIFSASAAQAATKPARSPAQSAAMMKPRLPITQLQRYIEITKQKMRQERKIADRKVHLKKLMRVLQGEFQKGAASFDLTFIFVNKTQLDIEYLLGNTCAKSRQLMAGQSIGADQSLQARQQRAAEVQASMSLHAAYCSAGK